MYHLWHWPHQPLHLFSQRLSKHFISNLKVVSTTLDRPSVYISVSPISALNVSIIHTCTYSYIHECLNLLHIAQTVYIYYRDLDGLSKTLSEDSTDNKPKTIVYTLTKNDACRVFAFLKSAARDKKCIGMYHANLTESTKTSVFNEFSQPSSRMRCLVATIAFGMVCTWMCAQLHVVFSDVFVNL